MALASRPWKIMGKMRRHVGGVNLQAPVRLQLLGVLREFLIDIGGGDFIIATASLREEQQASQS